jgi:hypothetical protein
MLERLNKKLFISCKELIFNFRKLGEDVLTVVLKVKRKMKEKERKREKFMKVHKRFCKYYL